jgi:ParB-like chromosome segregation protein Spo0J
VSAIVSPDLVRFLRPITDFRQDTRNARRHPPESIEAIKASLSSFGQQKPIVALASGQVVAGNGTLTAARELGWDKLAAVVFANEARATAYAVADNRTAELSTWDSATVAAARAEISANTRQTPRWRGTSYLSTMPSLR